MECMRINFHLLSDYSHWRKPEAENVLHFSIYRHMVTFHPASSTPNKDNNSITTDENEVLSVWWALVHRWLIRGAALIQP